MTKVDGEMKESKNAKDELECAEGWKWTDDWKLDQNRAVDEEGIIQWNEKKVTLLYYRFL